MNHKTLLFATLIIAGSLVMLSSCTKDNAEDIYKNILCDTTDVTFSKDVHPIIQSNCAKAGCHVEGSPSGYVYTTYEGLMKVVILGKILPAITHTGPIKMPMDAPKLDDCAIAKIRIW